MSTTTEPQFISIQQIRDDLNGFIDGLAQGNSYTVLRRSRKVAEVSGKSMEKPTKPVPGSKEAMREFLDIAAKIRAESKGNLDPNKSIKELYHEMLDEKYGFSRR